MSSRPLVLSDVFARIDPGTHRIEAVTKLSSEGFRNAQLHAATLSAFEIVGAAAMLYQPR